MKCGKKQVIYYLKTTVYVVQHSGVVVWKAPSVAQA